MGVDALMRVETDKLYTPKKVRKLAARLHDCFGDVCWVTRPDKYYPEGSHCLEIVADRPKLVIDVNLSCRYYGEGYERGPLVKLLGIASWLERNIRGASIFYGGDCDLDLQPFGSDVRDDLWEYYCSRGHEDYRGYSLSKRTEPNCDFCSVQLRDCGGGGGKTFLYCGGCGLKIIEESGAYSELRKYSDFFKPDIVGEWKPLD